MPSYSSRGLRQRRIAAAAKAADAIEASGTNYTAPEGPVTRRRVAKIAGVSGRPSSGISPRQYSLTRSSTGGGRAAFATAAKQGTLRQNQQEQQEQNKVVSSLEEALKVNRELQQAIRQQLAGLVERQIQTRIEAESCIAKRIISNGVLHHSNKAENIRDDLYPDWIKPREIQKFFQSLQNRPDQVSTDTASTATNIPKKSRNGPTDPTEGSIVPTTMKNSSELSTKQPANLVADTSTATTSASIVLPPNKVRQFRYQPFRRWTLEYFVDPTGSRPSPNADTIYRQQLRQRASCDCTVDAEGDNEESISLFEYQQQGHPSWTSQEHTILGELVGTATAHCDIADESSTVSPHTHIDFVVVAQELAHRCPLNITNASAAVHSTPTPLRRSPMDCEFEHRRRQQEKYPFTRDESLWILECIHALRLDGTQNQDASDEEIGGKTVESITTNEKNTIATYYSTSKEGTWSQIAHMVNKRRKQKLPKTSGTSAFLESTRTAWQCFCHYKQHLEPKNGSLSSQSINETSCTYNQEQQRQEDDEILLRYLAHQGPQFVWDTTSSTHAASRLFGSTGTSPSSRWTPLQIFQRSNWTAVFNPNLTTQPYWTSKPEQKLLLLMKIYHPIGNKGQHNNSEHNKHNDENEELDKCPDVDIIEENKEGKVPDFSKHKKRKRAPTFELSYSQKKQRKITFVKPPSAMAKVAPHFPERTRQQVAHKWERSLNPTLDHDKFTPQEDKLLRAILAEALQLPFSKGVDKVEFLPLLSQEHMHDLGDVHHDTNHVCSEHHEKHHEVDGCIFTKAGGMASNDATQTKKHDDSEKVRTKNQNNDIDDGDSVEHGIRTQDDGNTSAMSNPSPSSSWMVPPRIRDITKKHFPNRRPHQIYARWLEIATPQEMAEYHGLHLLLGKTGKNSASTLHFAASLVSPEDLRLEWIGD